MFYIGFKVAAMLATGVIASAAQAAFWTNAAPVASFTTQSGGIRWENSNFPQNTGVGGAIFTTANQSTFTGIPVLFSLPAANLLNVPAVFYLSGSTAGLPAPAIAVPGWGNFLEQRMLYGDFVFVDMAGVVLFQGGFRNARIRAKTTSPQFARFIGYSGFAPPAQGLQFSSPLVAFPPSPPALRYMDILKLAPTPALGALPGAALSTFDPPASGSFGFADPVPEPATWAMLVAGFGAIGFVARRRARRAVA
jgi:hypothetical protein